MTRQVLVFGSGDCGQLGLGEEIEMADTPTARDIIDICAGGLHNLALTRDGQVYSWGCNDEKALGHIAPEWSIGTVSFPQSISAKKITCGDSVSAALTDNGQVYAWGTYRDSQGVLGFDLKNRIQETASLIQVPFPATEISAGANHLMAICSNRTNGDTLIAWGCGEQGQLGRKVLSRHKIRGLKPENITPKRTGTFSRVCCGSYHTIALTHSGILYSCGLNNFGQLGLGDTEDRIGATILPGNIKWISAAAGEHHSIGLTSDGQVYTWGRGDSGQLGCGQMSERAVLSPHLVKNLPPISQIASGSNHCLALDFHNQLWVWGFGEMGQLGTGSEEDALSPVQIHLSKLKSVSQLQILKIQGGGQHSLLLVEHG